MEGNPIGHQTEIERSLKSGTVRAREREREGLCVTLTTSINSSVLWNRIASTNRIASVVLRRPTGGS